MTEVIIKTDIPGVKLLSRGKVRDIYDAGKHLLFVTTDRISAFDVVMD
ncbi:MAG: phosphoribosylaminoimidazolesuccinocarboxamide synthase, partial [Calditrichae bacterium]|nr:phosphoribosylaminoimidazolesuccinocarboxamide synthase [Calditrichia bacterium]